MAPASFKGSSGQAFWEILIAVVIGVLVWSCWMYPLARSALGQDSADITPKLNQIAASNKDMDARITFWFGPTVTIRSHVTEGSGILKMAGINRQSVCVSVVEDALMTSSDIKGFSITQLSVGGKNLTGTTLAELFYRVKTLCRSAVASGAPLIFHVIEGT